MWYAYATLHFECVAILLFFCEFAEKYLVILTLTLFFFVSLVPRYASIAMVVVYAHDLFNWSIWLPFS